MTEPNNELIYEVMKQIQAGMVDVRTELADLRGAVTKNTTQVRHTAQSLVRMNVQMKRFGDDLQILGLASDAHTQRLDRIDERLALPPYLDAE